MNDQPLRADLVDGYAVIDREWKGGDVVELKLPMLVHRVLANKQIKQDEGRVAVERGPLVYCVEGADHDGRVRNIWLPGDAPLVPEPTENLLGGVTVLNGTAMSLHRAGNGAVASRTKKVRMIPYHVWCHRGANEMMVWLPTSPEQCILPPAETIAFTSKKSASYVVRPGLLDGLVDQEAPQRSTDTETPWFTWWNQRGSNEWVQYEFEQPTVVSRTDVYWYEDRRLGIDVPQSWKLLYRDGDGWQAVKTQDAFATTKDQTNEVTFQPVKTDALRIEVQLQPKASGGILEWRVAGPEGDAEAAAN